MRETQKRAQENRTQKTLNLFLFSVFVCILLAPPTGRSAELSTKSVIFGYNPTENKEAAEFSARQFSQYFTGKLGAEVKTFVSNDYTALVEAMRGGRLDFAWMPPFSFIKAEEIAGAVPLLKSVYLGRSQVFSAIIVRADRGFHSIDDLKGKSIAWVDPSSASGHIFPKASLISHKHIDPDKFFKRQIFAGGHDAVVLAVYNGTVDAGATYMANEKGDEGSWTQFLKTPNEQKKIKIIFVSDPITSDLVTTTQKFQKKHPDVVEKMKKILAAMDKDPEGKRLLRDLYKVDALIPATSQDYEPVRAAARVLKLNHY